MGHYIEYAEQGECTHSNKKKETFVTYKVATIRTTDYSSILIKKKKTENREQCFSSHKIQ